MALTLHGNNGVITTNGTAAAPSLAAPDNDTGFFFDTNTIKATTSGSERLRISSGGRVNIADGNQTGSHLDYTRLNVYGQTNQGGADKNLNLLSVYNYGSGQVGDITGIGLGAGASPGGYTKASIGFIRTGTYGRGDLIFCINDQGNGNQVVEANERLRITSGGNLKVPDGAKIELGGAQTGAGDLSIWHDSGGNSYIKETGGGSLVINADDFYLQNVATTTFLRTHSSGAIELTHSGNTKLTTTSSGAVFTGTDFGFNVTPGGTPAGKAVFLAIGDSDTGIVQDGDGQLEIWGNAVEVANFNAIDGYTSTKPITTTGAVQTGDLTILNGNPDLRLKDSNHGGNNTEHMIAFQDSSGNNQMNIGSPFGEQHLRIKHGTTDLVKIQTDGKVGINCTNPGQLLEINGASNPCVLVKDTTNNCISYMYSQDSVATFGSASNHSVVFNVNNGEKARIDTNGYFGVGQSPNTKFNVALSSQQADGTDDASDWGAGGIFQLDAANTGTNNEVLLLGAHSGGVGQIASGIGFGRQNSSNWGTYLSFKTHSTGTSNIDELNERVRITAGGDVGINTNNPIRKLEVNGTARVSGAFEAYPSSTSAISAGTFYNNSTGPSADCRVQIKTYANQGADPYLHFDAGGSNFICGMKYEGTTQNKFMIGPGDSPSTGMTGGIYVHGNGRVSLNSSGIPSRRFNISDTGAVQIWTYGNCAGHFSAQYQSSTNSGTQYYNVFTRLDGSWDGYLVSSTDGQITLANNSDYRLKENVVSMTNGIDIVKKLNPITYKWKASTGRDTSVTMQGFFAHEVDEAGVLGAVDGEKDGVWDTAENPEDAAVGDPHYQGLSLERLVPALTAALKESIARIETLEAEVAALKGS